MKPMALGLRRPWSEWPPGWKWLAWGVTVAVLSAPVLIQFEVNGGEINAGDLKYCLGLGVLWWLPLLLLFVYRRRRALSILFALLFPLLVAQGPMQMCKCTRGFLGFHLHGFSRSQSTSDLKNIGTALLLYCDAKGRYPKGSGDEVLLELVRSGMTSLQVLRETRIRLLAPAERVDYAMNPALAGKEDPEAGVRDPSEVPWVYPKRPRSGQGGSGRMVLFLDHHVAWVGDAELQGMLKKEGGP